MSRYVAMIFIKDEEDQFTEGEIREQIVENMLQYADNAPFDIQGLKIEKLD
jgi:hypothetical protein